jgi:hypothetical protein
MIIRDWELGTGYWLVQAGLAILWLILHDIYKPDPMDWVLGNGLTFIFNTKSQ